MERPLGAPHHVESLLPIGVGDRLRQTLPTHVDTAESPPDDPIGNRTKDLEVGPVVLSVTPHTNTGTHTHTHMHTRACTHAHAHTRAAHAYAHACAHAHANAHTHAHALADALAHEGGPRAHCRHGMRANRSRAPTPGRVDCGARFQCSGQDVRAHVWRSGHRWSLADRRHAVHPPTDGQPADPCSASGEAGMVRRQTPGLASRPCDGMIVCCYSTRVAKAKLG